MQKTKVLVLGNSPQINSIAFDRIKPEVVTLGINRIWQKHIPKYFFFHDLIISNELSAHPETLSKLVQNSTIFSSEWIRKNRMNTIPQWTRVYPMPPRKQFPDSASLSIQILSKQILSKTPLTFYLAGIPLRWQEPSHFWKDSNESNSSHRKEWYDARFPMMIKNFEMLKKLGYDIVSVTPDSALNKIFRYENIENLYRK